MDEPFSSVDEQTRRKFQEDLIRLRTNQNKTFIFADYEGLRQGFPVTFVSTWRSM